MSPVAEGPDVGAAAVPSVADCCALIGAGRFAEAVQWLEIHHRTAPDDTAINHYLGLALHLCGRSAEALGYFETALSKTPDDPAILQNMVLPLIAVRQNDRAVAMARAGLALDPGSRGLHGNLILALSSAGKWPEARAACMAALAIDADDPGFLTQAGHVLLQLGDVTASEQALRRALQIRPQNPEATFNLGVVLQGQMREDEAVACYEQVLAIEPHHAGATNNLATSLRNLGRLAEAERLLQDLVGRDGDQTLSRFNLACVRLLAGKWQAAWVDYDLRDEAGKTPPAAHLTQAPRWRGEDISGKTLLVFHEQGLGDTIQFIRFLPRLMERVGRLVFVCQPQLAALLSTFALFRDPSGRAVLLADDGTAPAADYSVPLLSLPGILGLEPEEVGFHAPYLQADAHRSFIFNDPSLPGKDARRMRIGLAWQGNPRAFGEKGRSMALGELAPLAALSAEATFISLQRGFGSEQLPPDGLDLLQPGANFDGGSQAFVDTAALMMSLDLVITTDTAIAHLAGALGRPVWLLLKKAPDWRWGMEGSLTDWYPTMRLFRQSEKDRWPPVLNAVVDELRLLLSMPAAGSVVANDNEAHLGEAISAHQRKDYAAAIAVYRHLLAVGFRAAFVHNLLGMALLEAGGRRGAATRDAVVLTARSVGLASDIADHWSNFAVALESAGNAADALRALRHGLQADPLHLPSHMALARREVAGGKAEQALERARTMLARFPKSAHALSVFANAATALGRLEEADNALRRAVQIEPNNASTLVQWGAVLLKLERPDAAARAWEKAIVLEPGNADAWSNLGVAERNYGLADIACWFQRQAARTVPDHAESWSNLGISEMDAGREDEAKAAFLKAMALRPGYADAEMALGMALMNEGDYVRGLPLYERRLDVESLGIAKERVRLPAWKGESLAGKSILVLAEQGFGDAFQFIRYVAQLKAMGATRVIVGCRRKIASLIATAPGVDGVIGEAETVPALDYHVFMMSLPLYCGTTVESIPAAPSYLRADPARVTRWASWLAPRPGFRVGLVWQGNPDPKVDKGRSYPLEVLEPLADIPGLRLIALQKGAGEEQIAALGGRLTVESPGEDFDNGPDAFADTAALIMNLDLVITSDTAVAHLAGALGKPTWVVLKSHAEWRWLRGRSDSPWYPRTRVFRRVEGEIESRPFAGVASRVAGALRQLVSGDRSVLFEAAEPIVATHPPADDATAFGDALARHMAGDRSIAETGYAALLRSQSHGAEALHMLGALALEAQHYHRATLFLQAADRLGLGTSAFQTNYAIALRHIGKVEEAERLLRLSLQAAPSAEALMTLGNLLRDTNRFEEALAAYEASLVLRPDLAKTHRGKANALKDLSRCTDAIAAFDTALELSPGDAETLIDRGHAHLMAGNLPAGFRDYEYRWLGAEMVPRTFAVSRWQGEDTDKVLLIHGEQGLGDQIQFARFVALAAARVGHVLLELREPLIGLFNTLVFEKNNVTILRQSIDSIDDADLEVPMLSLPLALGTTLETLPAPARFMLPAERIAAWSERFSNREKVRVGLIWQGNPNARADQGRSPRLEVLAPLFDVEGAHFVSLQYADGLEQLRGFAYADRIDVPGASLGDFASTAAAISALDLVISSCTSTLHLAGSLGVPTFALLKYNADWRWMAHRTDSPWYPSVRLFRQPQPGDWGSVARQAAAALSDFVDARR
ncbi:tetratricopeptide repeat protein [Agrobacterium sp. a22-2]|uniref:tetratricopeptide repeat protein n=1 Tax=Agrobacterium sp. a22-2 TaxID=2283840 RepID=UPI0014472158|nr:tetratricopeptide repeat protein [Agrobacterium sp. a22-2]